MFYSIEEGPRARGLKHNPINALVAPRPIGWVSSIDLTGRVNLAPFSYFNLVAGDPPVVMFAPNDKDDRGTIKDTLRNVRETREFVINIVARNLRFAMNLTSTELPHGENEFLIAGLTEAKSVLVKPPRVAESPAALECRVCEIVALPHRPSGRRAHAVFGEVLGVHIDDQFIRDGVVDTLKIAPMARLGAFEYTCVDKIEVIPRPTGHGS
jgi:flavin reductase (DIM6/NTAB) family NADH-FMN oxidoreductase RutF